MLVDRKYVYGIIEVDKEVTVANLDYIREARCNLNYAELSRLGKKGAEARKRTRENKKPEPPKKSQQTDLFSHSSLPQYPD
jgi:hypothetical protein